MRKISSIIAVCLLLAHTVNAQTQKGQTIVGENPGDNSGSTISMPDANTIAIGAFANSDGAYYGGHVRVYEWGGSSWNQKGIDLDGVNEGDWFGHSVHMPDANTLAVGMPGNATGGLKTGMARVFEWNGSSWIQKGSSLIGEAPEDEFGNVVYMPSSTTLAVAAWKNDGTSTQAGHVRVFNWNGTDWVQKGVDIDGEAYGDFSGNAISMPDENTIAIGAQGNGAGGFLAGHARVYIWDGSSWVQRGTDIDGVMQSYTGYSVAMPDPFTLAVGAPAHDEVEQDAGKLRVYEWSGSDWTQRGSDINGDALYDNCGFSVAMPDANTILVSLVNKTIGSNYDAGEVRVYRWNTTINDWEQRASITGSADNDWLGWFVAMPDINTIAMGAREGGNGPGYVQVFDLCDVDTAVTVDWGILTSSTSTATSYQWLDCNNNYAQIAGATAQSFAPGVNGSYAVEITENGCVDTSACVLVDWVNISELTMENEVLVYPNPSNGLVHVLFRKQYEAASVKVISITGSLVYEEKVGEENQIELDLSDLSGVYVLEIKTNQQTVVRERILLK